MQILLNKNQPVPPDCRVDKTIPRYVYRLYQRCRGAHSQSRILAPPKPLELVDYGKGSIENTPIHWDRELGMHLLHEFVYSATIHDPLL